MVGFYLGIDYGAKGLAIGVGDEASPGSRRRSGFGAAIAAFGESVRLVATPGCRWPAALLAQVFRVPADPLKTPRLEREDHARCSVYRPLAALDPLCDFCWGLGLAGKSREEKSGEGRVVLTMEEQAEQSDACQCCHPNPLWVVWILEELQRLMQSVGMLHGERGVLAP